MQNLRRTSTMDPSKGGTPMSFPAVGGTVQPGSGNESSGASSMVRQGPFLALTDKPWNKDKADNKTEPNSHPVSPKSRPVKAADSTSLDQTPQATHLRPSRSPSSTQIFQKPSNPSQQ